MAKYKNQLKKVMSKIRRDCASPLPASWEMRIKGIGEDADAHIAELEANQKPSHYDGDWPGRGPCGCEKCLNARIAELTAEINDLRATAERHLEHKDAQLAAADRLAKAMIRHRKARRELGAADWSASDPAYLKLVDEESEASLGLFNADQGFLSAYTQTKTTPTAAKEAADDSN